MSRPAKRAPEPPSGWFARYLTYLIAVGGTDKTRLRRLWVDTLGLELGGNYRSEKENVDEDICSGDHACIRLSVRAVRGRTVEYWRGPGFRGRYRPDP